MNELDQELEMTKLERYLKREGRQDFVDEMHRASPVQLDSRMLGLTKHREEIDTTRNNDEDLKKAKNEAKALGATYREQTKMNKKLTRLVALLMAEKGVPLSK
jgi:hypothetical protein